MDQPIRQILGRPDVAGRMMKWSLKLSEFDIHYESRKALKAQVFADFLAEMTFPTEDSPEDWTVFVDGSSNSKGSGAGIIVEDNKGIVVEISLALSFPVTNNTIEYEAFLDDLRTAKDMGARKVKIFTDLQLVASQVTGEFQVKEHRLQKYVQLVLEKMKEFETVEVTHVPREQNTRADILSKLAIRELRTETKQLYRRFSVNQASRIEELSLKRSMRSSEWKTGEDPSLDT
jgi:ribonuclease HI